jgi:hypothetical protein
MKKKCILTVSLYNVHQQQMLCKASELCEIAKNACEKYGGLCRIRAGPAF